MNHTENSKAYPHRPPRFMVGLATIGPLDNLLAKRIDGRPFLFRRRGDVAWRIRHPDGIRANLALDVAIFLEEI